MIRNKVMIIGGHGAVGQSIVRSLSHVPLVIAGRNKEKMQAFVTAEGLSCDIRVFDIHAFNTVVLQDIHMVIVCVDQVDTHLIQYCIDNAIDYMDITANSSFIQKAMKLKNPNNTNVLLGVGLAPGITNVLAEYAINQDPSASSVAIDIILGLRDHHGDAAVDWTLANMIQPYDIRDQSVLKPFARRHQFKLSQAAYETYNFDFADQHILNFHYPHVQFTTFLGFDNRIVTRLIHHMSTLGLLKALKYKPIKKFVATLLKQQFLGTDLFVAHVETDSLSICAYGHKEGAITATIASTSARAMLELKEKKGFLNMSDLIDIEALKAINSLTLTVVLKHV